MGEEEKLDTDETAFVTANNTYRSPGQDSTLYHSARSQLAPNQNPPSTSQSNPSQLVSQMKSKEQQLRKNQNPSNIHHRQVSFNID
jgi:hypothetical protein